jgi:hypothetical protein
MQGLIFWLVRKYLPGYLLLGTVDIAVIRKLLAEYAPGHHLTRSQGKGSRKAKKAAIADAQKQAIKEYHEDPKEEVLGD